MTRAQFIATIAAFAQANKHDRLNDLVPRLLQDHQVPGLSLAVIEDGRVSWSKAFGVRSNDSKDPVDTNTVSEAASLSKPAFAFVVMKLIAQGKLRLDDPLTHYTPEPLIPNEPKLKLITARMVLAHMSGLPHGRRAETALALRFDPGKRFAYSSTGIEYLRAVVERIANQTLPELIEQHLLQPLDMKNSSFGWRDSFQRNYAKGHSRSGRIGLTANGEYLEATPEEKQQQARDYPEYRYPSASAGMYTTAADYGRFVCEMMRPANDSLLNEMMKPQIRINDSISWGLGWGLESTSAGDAFWHWGDWGVFRNFAIGYRKSRLGVVVLTNSFHGPKVYSRIISEITGERHPAFAWVDSYRP